VAVITGDNSGIGLAATQEFIEQGAKVAIFGRNAATLAEAAEQVGSNVLAIQGEVTQMADLECLFRKTETKAVAFLVSPDSLFIVGTEVVADGG
jgi:NAD(P)-dependent dehydrogenase (short-subunit alcohol dehydrogenase family)